jgi:hypothetical protein
MNALGEKRRSFLLALGAVGIARALPSGTPQARSEAARGFVRGTLASIDGRSLSRLPCRCASSGTERDRPLLIDTRSWLENPRTPRPTSDVAL